MTEYALAADLGGTNIRVALVDADGNISARHSTETLAREGRDAVMNRLVDAFEHVASTRLPAVKGVGLSLASPVEPGTGVMYNPPNLGKEWHLFTPIPYLQERLNLPVQAGNDATLAAIGEHAYGAGKGLRNMVYMTVSTGIGGGVIINGDLHRVQRLRRRDRTHDYRPEWSHVQLRQCGMLGGAGVRRGGGANGARAIEGRGERRDA